MTEPEKASPSDETLDSAIAWHMRLHSGDASEEDWLAFTQWLEENSEHRLAFDRLDDLHRDLDEVKLSDLAPATVAIFDNLRGTSHRSPARRVAAWSAAALLAASVAIGINLYRSQPLTDYETRVGETRTIALADGSTIALNTATKISVSVEGRQARLESGEAIFHIVKDEAHPFQVTAGDRDVRDIGTTFNILRAHKAMVTVTVSEGAVAVAKVDEDASAAQAIRLAAGDQLVYRDGMAQAVVRHVRADDIIAWHKGYLSYENAPLSQVVSDLNRYFLKPVSVGDATTANRRFSGILKLDDEDTMLTRLKEFLPVTTDRGADGGIVLHTRP